MQDPTSQAAASAYYYNNNQPELLQPEQEQLKCPRCNSANTKFCYYNNYNLSQPRHFCKNCRRYWTKGGSLRNIPVGGGIRKNIKRSSPSSSSASASSSSKNQKTSSEPDLKSGSGSGSGLKLEKVDLGQGSDPTRMLYGLPVGGPSSGSFSSLLASHMQMGGAGIMYGTGSGNWIPGVVLDSGSRGNDDKWTSMNRVEKN